MGAASVFSTLNWLNKNVHALGCDKCTDGNQYCQKKIFIMHC